jgi:CHAT domain-containing protein
MNQDFNPGRSGNNPPGNSEEPMAGALEALIQKRLRSRDLWRTPAGPDAGQNPISESGMGHCPELETWGPLFRSQPAEADQSKAYALLEHASGCALCARWLRALVAEPQDEEASFLAGIDCASELEHQKLAEALARTPRREATETTEPMLVVRSGAASARAKGRATRAYPWMGAGLAASLLIAAGVLSWWRTANTPERLIADAYGHDRIFELRMPGAEYSDVTPQRHVRGSSTGRESSKLLEARARIERQLEAAPEDPHWLELEARSDVLEERFDAAIDILDRLIAAGPVTPGLLLDDASAYFQRGTATGSENDRATALDYLRRADEMTPGDPVILFNEAVAMEDRGQVMNAVETWNRYLQFERDPRWLAEGRRRLAALEEKLNQLKTHQSRMEQHLASPAAMRALAQDRAGLAKVDEELSTTRLPQLLNAAFPLTLVSAEARSPTPDRSRGSPCRDDCQAARTLLGALAASLKRNHNDRWLSELLPSDLSRSESPVDIKFAEAAQALARAIEADVRGDYLNAAESAQLAAQRFRALSKQALSRRAGVERADLERADALQATANYAGCYRAAHMLADGDGQFAWIHAEAEALNAYCDPAPGSDAENNPSFRRAEDLAHAGHYGLLELRVRNMRGGAAVDGGDVEAAWRDYRATIRQLYAGDYPALRLSSSLSGLEQVEQATPRAQLALLLQREAVETLELTENRQLLPTARLNLAAAAIRAGSLDEAQAAMHRAQSELAANGGGKSVVSILAEVETALASVYLERREANEAAELLDAAEEHMAGERNAVRLRNYAVARGQLALEQGHGQAAEAGLRDALVEQERLGGKGGAEAIAQAEQNRDLYAVLAGVWLAENKPGAKVLALWERYRLRVLGIRVAACADKDLDCLQAELEAAAKRPDFGVLTGQIVLPDRLLLYRASGLGVRWVQVLSRREEVEAATERLEWAVNSPHTSQAAVEQAERGVGALLIDPLNAGAGDDSIASSGGLPARLRLEPDPLLGNLPWPAVATVAGALGMLTDLEESPSMLLERPAADGTSTGQALVVGASVAAGEKQLLPEVLEEAQAVARFDKDPSLLMGEQATASEVMARLATAEAIHFAGHAESMEGGTRLLLAPAGADVARVQTSWLDSAMLRRHPPRLARLAVFSACSSGKKEAGWNHGMGDIVDAMAALGVADVVATRWQIDSSAAVPMMDAFYGGLAGGLTVPQALRGARQAMVRDPHYRHPYYWAAWYASGTGTADLSPIFQREK